MRSPRTRVPCPLGTWVAVGAESGDLPGWTADEGVVVSQGTESFDPLAGEWLFLMGDDVPMGEHSESMHQAVDVAGCSNEFINGKFTASGWVATDANHWGTFTLDFGEGPLVVVDLLQIAAPDEWTEFGPISGPVQNVDTGGESCIDRGNVEIDAGNNDDVDDGET